MDGNCVLASCLPDGKCPNGAECITITGGVSYCACPKGYKSIPDGSCQDVNECTEGHKACGYGAECINLPGSFECHCPHGYSGDPYNGLCAPSQKRCISDNECSVNEKCVQPGECICPPPYFSDPLDNNKCKNPCERFACGINAKCTPSDPPRCTCEKGFTGNPLQGCVDIDECVNTPCAYGAHCINQRGGFKCVCPRGTMGDPYKTECILATTGVGRVECTSDNDCAPTLACADGSCVNPCGSIQCGANAYCEPERHSAWCKCAIGYAESSTGQCVSSMSISFYVTIRF